MFDVVVCRLDSGSARSARNRGAPVLQAAHGAEWGLFYQGRVFGADFLGSLPDREGHGQNDNRG